MKRIAIVIAAGALSILAATSGTQPPVNEGYGDFVYIPAGAFKMGDTFGDGLPRERPAHTVDLDAFYIAKYETTNAQWRKFRDDPGYDDVKYWPNGKVVRKDQVSYWMNASNHGGGTPDSDDYPVMGVNWDSATAYCNWVSAKTGKKYRLPTEAEWEKAARGTDQRRYPWGNEIEHADANYVGTQKMDTSMKVGSFPKGVSPYGVYDMAGNISEWCSDWYSRDYYSVSPKKNPKGPATGAYKVVRGGSFFLEALDMRTYARSAAWPSFLAHRMIGFRAAREP